MSVLKREPQPITEDFVTNHKFLRSNRFQCDHCNFGTRLGWYFDLHRQRHANMAKIRMGIGYFCDHCQNAETEYRDWQTFYTHMDQVHDFKRAVERRAEKSGDLVILEKEEKPITATNFQNWGPRNQAKLQCGECNFGTWKRWFFNLHHLRHVHIERVKLGFGYFCHKCPELTEFKYMHSYHEHMTTTHPSGTIALEKKVRRRAVDANGMPVKNGKLGKYDCPDCGKDYPYLKALHKHMYERGKFHDGRCRLCEKKFDTWADHKIHVQKEHGGKFLIRCGQCDMVFDIPERYRFHLKTKKEDRCKGQIQKELEQGRNYICDICSKTFKTRAHMKDHQISAHDNSGSFPCSECQKIFPNPLKLKTHWTEHHDYSTCDSCGRTFGNKRKLKMHVLKDHTNVEDLPYKCDMCLKRFPSRQALNYHMETHKEGEVYQCQFCGKGFGHAQNRAAHERSVHHGIKKKKKKKYKKKPVDQAAQPPPPEPTPQPAPAPPVPQIVPQVQVPQILQMAEIHLQPQ